MRNVFSLPGWHDIHLTDTHIACGRGRLFRCWLPVPGSYIDFIYIAPILGVLLVKKVFKLHIFLFPHQPTCVFVVKFVEFSFRVLIDNIRYSITWSSTFGWVCLSEEVYSSSTKLAR